MRKKLIFCTDGIFPHAIGGMQRHSRLLIEHLAKQNNLDILVVHPHKVKVFEEYSNITEARIKAIDSSKNYLLECYKYSQRVYDVVAKHPEAVVYSQGLSIWSNIKKVKDRLIVNPHGLEPYQALGYKDKILAIPFKLIFNYIFNNSKYVISLGGKLTDILLEHIKEPTKIRVIPNAVSVAEKSNFQKQKIDKKLKALFVARFAHNKGIHILMEAIEKLNDNGYSNDIHFNLVGKGPLFEHYSSNYRFNNISYHGFVDDEELNLLYKISDVFVFPTLFEGMPTVVLEAMAKGLPIIVSDTGATAELVDDENGYLIERGRTESLLNALIDFIHQDEDAKANLGNVSYNKVKARFTWKAVADTTFELINKA